MPPRLQSRSSSRASGRPSAGIIYEEFTSKEHEILTGVVSHIEPRNGSVSIRISSNSEFTEAMLAPNERIKTEELHEGDHIKVYVVEVRNSTRGPQVLISRTHPGLVKRLFELEVPEIYDGTVEIKSIAREAGSRTKMAVWSADPDVDPIGSCVGPKGGRVASIVNELGGEKIDIIKYSEVPEEYIAAALSPSEVLSVTMLEDGKSCRVIVPDSQLSLAIGKEGQNARLAAKLTGYKIDIKPESEA
ncbi:MAG: transcription termination factor NusA [Oscillospiraceae bacterium]